MSMTQTCEMQGLIPAEFLEHADAFPPALRALLDAELAAGNTIASASHGVPSLLDAELAARNSTAQAGHGFPSRPSSGYFMMTGAVTTRPRESGGGLIFRDYGHCLHSGSFTDVRGCFFILEPPSPPRDQPSIEPIRAAHAPPPFGPPPIHGDSNTDDRAVDARGASYHNTAVPNVADPDTALARFERSMAIDENRDDDLGYDLRALAAATPAERDIIEVLVVQHGIKDWRDVEALAALNTPLADNVLKTAIRYPDPEILLAVAHYAWRLIPPTQRTASLVRALKTASLSGGLLGALDEAAEFHPREVVEALFHGALHRDGQSAVHFAALLMFVHQKADSTFDWDQFSFFIRFNTQSRSERKAVFMELCEKIGVDSSDYL